jgi:RNA-directed DNA polymerase
MGSRKSDNSIVLGGWESQPHGEGSCDSTQTAKETSSGSVRLGQWMPTSLRCIAQIAKHNKRERFRSLYSLLNKSNLTRSFHSMNKRSASGVDSVSHQEYGLALETNLENLVSRLKEKRYKAKLIKRVYIPKASGAKRPLGLPATEDKILQSAVTEIISSIYETDFLECSYGYRPERSAHQALHSLYHTLTDRTRAVVEADIRDFFGSIDHEILIKMLEQRVDDKALVGLIRKWLKAGVLELDGSVVNPTTGTPQGGVISPVLGNIYLHYVLDLWLEKVVKPSFRGKVNLIRFADDFVVTFEYETEAKEFMGQLKQRLGKFGLELSPSKTRMLKFNRFEEGNDRLEFLGFELSWQRNQKGYKYIAIRTSRKKLASSMQNIKGWLGRNVCFPVNEVIANLNVKLTGYYNYYGIRGNTNSVWRVYETVRSMMFSKLNRRSQRRSYTWESYTDLLRDAGIKKPVIRKSILDKSGIVCYV